MQTRLLRQVGTHVLVADDRHPRDVRVVPGEIHSLKRLISQNVMQVYQDKTIRLVHLPFYPVFVVGDVFSVEQLVWWRVLPQFMLRRRTRVHEGLSHHRQTGVCNAVLVNVKDELRVLDDVHPEPQWKTGGNDEKQGQGRKREKI